MRKVALALLVLGLVLLPGIRAWGCVNGESGEYLDCLEKELGSQPSSGVYAPTSGQGSSSTPGRSQSLAIKYIPYDRLVMQPDGQGCATVGYVAEGIQPTDAVPPDPSRTDPVAAHGNVYAEYPPCPSLPSQPSQPGAQQPVLTEAMLAAQYWERVYLPVPAPSIAPGRAISGKPAYLETRGKLEHSYLDSTVFGPLVIHARGSYSVAWGDGTVDGPYTFEGTAWPSGQITHEYQSVGLYDVVVTERWTATWSLNGKSGILRALQTVGRIEDFRVEQIQAVIGR